MRKLKITIYLLIIGFLIYHFFLKNTGSFKFDFFDVQGIKSSDDPGLTEIVRSDLQGQKGDFGIYIKELGKEKPKIYTLNESSNFPSASLYKLVLMAAIYQEVQDGKLKNDDVISDTKEHLSSILGSNEFGYEDVQDPIEYTVDEALQRVATISDNYAAIMLTNKLQSKDELQKMAQELGMKNTNFSENGITTTPDDIALYFEKLYLNQVVSFQISQNILTLLAADKINNRIPAQLPISDDQGNVSLKIAHKTGELPLLRHDAGIVFLSNDPYLIVLMSQNLQYEDEGVNTLAKISKDVYDYLAKEPLSPSPSGNSE